MKAELARLVGEQYMLLGNTASSMDYLLQSIAKNKRESKTWVSYAKLNEMIFAQKKDEKSALNACKGYFCAMTLSQHKARLIMPYVFKLLKHNITYTS